MKARERLDRLMVDRGLAETRNRAQALIMAGRVRVEGRPVTKAGTLRGSSLSDKSVALIVKKYAALAGLDPKDFAGHSLRRGFATSAAQHDVDTLSIMRQTRHKSEKMVHRYIEQGNLFKENPLNRMFGTPNPRR